MTRTHFVTSLLVLPLIGSIGSGREWARRAHSRLKGKDQESQSSASIPSSLTSAVVLLPSSPCKWARPEVQVSKMKVISPQRESSGFGSANVPLTAMNRSRVTDLPNRIGSTAVSESNHSLWPLERQP